MVVVTSTVNAVRQSSNVFVISFQGGTGTPGGTGLEGPLGPSVSYTRYFVFYFCESLLGKIPTEHAMAACIY